MNLVGSRRGRKASVDRAIRVRGRKVKKRDEVREVGGGPDYTGSYSH